jgi:hypothetical protein
VPDDEKIDEFIGLHAAGYRADARTPVDEIWGRIERDVAGAIGAAPRRGARGRVWLFAGAGLAATLLLGIGIGRWSRQQSPAAPSVNRVAATHDDSLQRIAQLRAAATDHLGETEVFLTGVRADLRAGRSDADRADRSRALLARTRLLQQRRELQSPGVTRLLDDIELLLAEIAALPDSGQRPRPVDSELLEETLSRNDIIPRIRTTVPARAAGS